jgi:hypothetical protein
MNLKLTAKNATEERVLAYLQENVSEILAGKINAGSKTLSGALSYAKDEARKLASGESCVCVDDATVFGWIIHYFEEDHVNSENKKPCVCLPGGVKKAKLAPAAKPSKIAKPVEPEKPAQPQLTMFESLFGVAP